MFSALNCPVQPINGKSSVIYHVTSPSGDSITFKRLKDRLKKINPDQTDCKVD